MTTLHARGGGLSAALVLEVTGVNRPDAGVDAAIED